MSISAINPNIGEVFNVKPPESKSAASQINYNGPSFSESLSDLARVTIGKGNHAAALNLSRQKEEFDEPFSFLEAEEEIAEQYITRIKEFLRNLKE